MIITRTFSEAVNSVMLKLKKAQRIKNQSSGALIKLNLGCGLAVQNTWINIDGSLNAMIAGFPSFLHSLAFKISGAREYYSLEKYCEILNKNRFVHHDLSHSIPCEDETVDFIFTSHFLEHLFKKDAENFLSEAVRVLKPGGVIRLSVPDLEFAVKLYSQGDKARMLESYFFVDHNENYFSRHKYMYDFDLLSRMFEIAGFVNIKRCDFNEGSIPDIEFLDNRPEDSLFIEAMKSKS